MLNKRAFIGCSNLSSLKAITRFLIWIYFLCFFIDKSDSLSDSPSPLMQCYREIFQNKSSFERVPRHEPKCETFGCVKVAAQIVSYLNETIDPCDDFYHFANGHFIDDKYDDTEDDQSTTFLSEVSDLVNSKVRRLLKEPLKSNERKPFELAKNFYKSCINQKTSRPGDRTLNDILESLGSWPVVKGKLWRARDFDFIELIKKVKEVGFDTNIIFDVNVDIDPNNFTKRVLQIDSGDYAFHDDESLMKYQKEIFENVTIFLGKIDAATKERVMKETAMILTFESKLMSMAFGSGSGESSNTDSENYTESDADSENYSESETDSENYTESDADSENYTDDDIDNNNIYFDTTTIKGLQESYPYLNWLEYIQAILPSGLNVTENEPIVNLKPQFFEQLGDLMNSTSPRTIANYILWRAIYKSYQMQMYETGKVRRDKCIQSTVEKLTVPVGLLYSRKYFDKKSRKAVIDLVEDIRDAFINLLGEVTWMDDDTREKAIAKAKNVIAYIGYPDKWYDEDAELSEYYEDLKMKPDNFFINSLRWNLFNNNQKFKTLRKPVKRSPWELLFEFSPLKATAYYYDELNSINFPVAILHELLFSVDRPQYINYAKLGYVIGHEITHGFDNHGCEYDLNGDFNNWWSPESKENFTEKAECIINQYNHYTDRKTNLTINGERTLAENIADNAGARAAYYAYQNWIKRNEPERLVPGVQYNQNQLFWISLAQSHSSVDGEMMLREKILTDEHSPGEFRVNGVVRNLEEFARDFNCAVGTKMNPEAGKCKMW